MSKRTVTMATVLGMGVALASGAAIAGPCSADIAELAPRVGTGPTTGPLAATGAGATTGSAAGGGTPAPDRVAGTSADRRQGGTAGTREMNAVVGNQVATSSDDVRRQQQGQPTAAAEAESGRRAQSDRAGVEVVPGSQGAVPPAGDSRMALARTELEAARALDAQDDRACSDAIGRVRQILQSAR